MVVKVVTDSACDLPPDLVRQLDINIVPIRVNWGRHSFFDGEQPPPGLPLSIKTPGGGATTSQPTPWDFDAVFRSLSNSGHDIICITMSSVLSGTYHSAMIAARDKANVQVLDSGLVSAGQGKLVLSAANRAAQGHDLSELVEQLQREKKEIQVFAVLDDMEPIVQGGRLNIFSRQAQQIEGIKILFTINQQGGVQILQRVRGRQRSLRRLVDLVEDYCPVAVSYVDCVGEAEFVAAQLEERCGQQPLFFTGAGNTVSTYTGRGAIIVAG